jgi:hypothetical protein
VRVTEIAIFDPGAIEGIVGPDAVLLAAEVSDSILRDDLEPNQLSYAQAGVPN